MNSEDPGLEVIPRRGVCVCVWCREQKGVVGNNEVIIIVPSLKHIYFLTMFTFTTHVPRKAFQKLRTM